MRNAINVYIEHTPSTVVLLTPTGARPRRWLREHTEPDAIWLDGSLPVEVRYVEPILLAAALDGIRIHAQLRP